MTTQTPVSDARLADLYFFPLSVKMDNAMRSDVTLALSELMDRRRATADVTEARWHEVQRAYDVICSGEAPYSARECQASAILFAALNPPMGR